MMPNISDSLVALRRRRGLNQEEAGKLLGVTGKYVSMLERGAKDVSADSALAKLLRVYEDQDAVQGNSVSHARISGARGQLQAARQAKGMSQKEVAKAVGYSLGVYQGIEEGSSRMGRKQAEKLAEVLGIGADELLDGSDHPPEQGGMFGSFGEIPGIRVPKGMKVKYVPLISMAECGPNMAWDDGAYTGQGFAVFDSRDPKAFAVQLSGKSMTPIYEQGDVAVVYPSFQPRNGDVVIARLDEDHGADVMCKVYQASQDTITLSSYNPAYEPIKWPRSCFTWIYPVVQVMKTLRPLTP